MVPFQFSCFDIHCTYSLRSCDVQETAVVKQQVGAPEIGKPRELKRGLRNGHIQLIALGGAIGTGLFLGIGPAAVLAGPSVILGYALAGFIAFLIMRQLGEMVVDEPVSGSFSHFAYKYW